MRGSKQAVLLAVCLATSAAARTPRNNYNSIFARAQACSFASYIACSNTGLPSDFCCPSGSNCLALAGNTTVLCCPTGQTCQTIKPITCDISQQNNTLHPDNELKTIALNSSLPTCASSCCPFGYTCNSGGNCVINADQTAFPPGFTSQSTTSATSTSPSSTSSTDKPSTTSSSSQSTTPAPITKSTSEFPAKAIIVGLASGLIAGILLTLLAIWCYGARRNRKSKKSQNDRRRSGSSFGNISEPQPIDNDMRSDFLRKVPGTPSSTTASNTTPARRNTMKGRVTGIFRKSKGGWTQDREMREQMPMPLNVNKNMGVNERPVTPPNQREPSGYLATFALDDGASPRPSIPQNQERERERERAEGGLRPPPALGNGGHRDSTGSYLTSMSDVIHWTRESGAPPHPEEAPRLAGLKKGEPYVWKGVEYGSPPR